ncbi:MAG: hypothetical protein ACRD2B_05995 [Terriglobia bacterium]
MSNNCQSVASVDVCPPVRNRFFYGKLLDVYHFELEQNYFNSKRWMLNRLVSGYGVICGLNVLLGQDGESVVVTPGVAIDKCGREVIVCKQSAPITLPPPQAPPSSGSAQNGSTAASAPANGAAQPAAQATGCSDTGLHQYLSICYHECLADPSPALGGDCDTQALCTPGSVREGYCLKLTDGKLCPASTTSHLQDVISGGALNYAALANYISNTPCAGTSKDSCIPLANIQIPAPPANYTQNSIDITVRPIVYTLDMLYDLLLAWMNQGQAQSRGGK